MNPSVSRIEGGRTAYTEGVDAIMSGFGVEACHGRDGFRGTIGSLSTAQSVEICGTIAMGAVIRIRYAVGVIRRQMTEVEAVEVDSRARRRGRCGARRCARSRARRCARSRARRRARRRVRCCTTSAGRRAKRRAKRVRGRVWRLGTARQCYWRIWPYKYVSRVDNNDEEQKENGGVRWRRWNRATQSPITFQHVVADEATKSMASYRTTTRTSRRDKAIATGRDFDDVRNACP